VDSATHSVSETTHPFHGSQPKSCRTPLPGSRDCTLHCTNQCFHILPLGPSDTWVSHDTYLFIYSLLPTFPCAPATPLLLPFQPTVRLSSIFTHSQYFVFSNAHVSLLHLCRESQHSLCDIPGNGPRTHRGTAAYYMQHTGFLFSQHFFQPSLRVLPLTVGAAPLIPRGVSTLAPCGMSTQSRSL
jgi:hypothetical protein